MVDGECVKITKRTTKSVLLTVLIFDWEERMYDAPEQVRVK